MGEGTQPLLPAALGEDAALADGLATAVLNHFGPRDQALARGGLQVVNLELDRDHIAEHRAGGEGERCIRQRCDDSAVGDAVLLQVRGPQLKEELNGSRPDVAQAGSDQRAKGLLVEDLLSEGVQIFIGGHGPRFSTTWL